MRLVVIGPVNYRIGYARGAAVAESQVSEGKTHQFAQRARGHRWCLVSDSTAPAYLRFCGYNSGIGESLPDHSGDTYHARQALEEVGAVFKVKAYGIVTKISATDSRITDADVHWFDAFPHLTELSIVSSVISDDSLKHLMILRKLTNLTIVDSQLTESGARELLGRYSVVAIRNEGQFDFNNE
jgi:hypothetical protein